MADAIWYVGQGGERKGPFTSEEVAALVIRGEVAPADLAWREGMAEWSPVGQIPELQPPAPEAAPALEIAPEPPEPKEEAAWYIGRGAQQLGPFTTSRLREMAARGEVTRNDMVWKEGMANWQPASAIPELAGSLKAGPPPMAPVGTIGPSPAAELFSGLLGDLKAIVADPEAGIKAIAGRKAVPNAFICIGIFAVVAGLLGLQVVAQIPFASGGDVIKAFFKSLLSGVVAQAVLFGALYLTLGPILKATLDWQAPLAIVGLCAIPLAATGIVVFVFAWLTWYAVGLWAGGLPAFVLVLHEAFVHTSKAPRKVALYAVPAICLATAIVLGILARLFAV